MADSTYSLIVKGLFIFSSRSLISSGQIPTFKIILPPAPKLRHASKAIRYFSAPRQIEVRPDTQKTAHSIPDENEYANSFSQEEWRPAAHDQRTPGRRLEFSNDENIYDNPPELYEEPMNENTRRMTQNNVSFHPQNDDEAGLYVEPNHARPPAPLPKNVSRYHNA